MGQEIVDICEIVELSEASSLVFTAENLPIHPHNVQKIFFRPTKPTSKMYFPSGWQEDRKTGKQEGRKTGKAVS